MLNLENNYMVELIPTNMVKLFNLNRLDMNSTYLMSLPFYMGGGGKVLSKDKIINKLFIVVL